MSAAEQSRSRAIELATKAIDPSGGASERVLVCVVGPTASGKTDLAMSICEALGGEIISADSIQIYKGFDIGSGKVTAEEMARVPHHLVSTLDPLEMIDAAAWAKLAAEAITNVRARGRVPIVCGGTFFWIRALVLGLVEAPAADPEIRARHRALALEKGRAALHDELRKIDPVSADRLHPNDVVRVSRALEVAELSGRTMSQWQEEHGFKERRFDATLLALAHDNATLTARIGARVDGWLANDAWLDEVRTLVSAGYREARAMGSVGYAEVLAHLEGKLPRAELRDAIVRSTRVFARRQRTWLNHADVTWL